MINEEKPTTLVDQWLTKLKNHPLLAMICVLGIVVAGIDSFTESLKNMGLIGSTPPQPPPIVVQIPDMPVQPPKRVYFKEEFELGQRAIFVSNNGVSVETGFIMILEGQGLVADVGASAAGPVEWLSRVRKGKQIQLHRSDCDALMVTINDIQFDTKVTGVVTGKCEETS